VASDSAVDTSLLHRAFENLLSLPIYLDLSLLGLELESDRHRHWQVHHRRTDKHLVQTQERLRSFENEYQLPFISYELVDMGNEQDITLDRSAERAQGTEGSIICMLNTLKWKFELSREPLINGMRLELLNPETRSKVVNVLNMQACP
jgi:hypothetical protein